MQNKYPLWKNIVLIIVVIMGLVYRMQVGKSILATVGDGRLSLWMGGLFALEQRLGKRLVVLSCRDAPRARTQADAMASVQPQAASATTIAFVCPMRAVHVTSITP